MATVYYEQYVHKQACEVLMDATENLVTIFPLWLSVDTWDL